MLSAWDGSAGLAAMPGRARCCKTNTRVLIIIVSVTLNWLHYVIIQLIAHEFSHINRFKRKMSYNKASLLQVYQNLYPWRSLNDFVTQLKSTIAYKSQDNSLVALNKPFGVGVFKVLDANGSKQNADRILSNVAGSPKYCLSDALDPLTQEFNSPREYTILKGIDRYMSGLTLITNDEKHKEHFKRATATSRINRHPPFGFRAITNGYPTIPSDRIYESVGMELMEVDELGDYKEPIISMNPGSTFQRKANRKMYQAELVVKKINREISASLVEMYTSNLMWDFPRCYISSKTAYILGDVRFSRRIREVLGKRMQVSAFKASGRYDDMYEPLGSTISSLLGVKKNNQIPLMLDLNCLRLKNYYKRSKEDLIIQSPYMPLHFALTAKRLNLIDDVEESNESKGDHSDQAKCEHLQMHAQ